MGASCQDNENEDPRMTRMCVHDSLPDGLTPETLLEVGTAMTAQNESFLAWLYPTDPSRTPALPAWDDPNAPQDPPAPSIGTATPAGQTGRSDSENTSRPTTRGDGVSRLEMGTPVPPSAGPTPVPPVGDRPKFVTKKRNLLDAPLASRKTQAASALATLETVMSGSSAALTSTDTPTPVAHAMSPSLLCIEFASPAEAQFRIAQLFLFLYDPKHRAHGIFSNLVMTPVQFRFFVANGYRPAQTVWTERVPLPPTSHLSDASLALSVRHILAATYPQQFASLLPFLFNDEQEVMRTRTAGSVGSTVGGGVVVTATGATPAVLTTPRYEPLSYFRAGSEPLDMERLRPPPVHVFKGTVRGGVADPASFSTANTASVLYFTPHRVGRLVTDASVSRVVSAQAALLGLAGFQPPRLPSRVYANARAAHRDDAAVQKFQGNVLMWTRRQLQEDQALARLTEARARVMEQRLQRQVQQEAQQEAAQRKAERLAMEKLAAQRAARVADDATEAAAARVQQMQHEARHRVRQRQVELKEQELARQRVADKEAQVLLEQQQRQIMQREQELRVVKLQHADAAARAAQVKADRMLSASFLRQAHSMSKQVSSGTRYRQQQDQEHEVFAKVQEKKREHATHRRALEHNLFDAFQNKRNAVRAQSEQLLAQLAQRQVDAQRQMAAARSQRDQLRAIRDLVAQAKSPRPLSLHLRSYGDSMQPQPGDAPRHVLSVPQYTAAELGAAMDSDEALALQITALENLANQCREEMTRTPATPLTSSATPVPGPRPGSHVGVDSAHGTRLQSGMTPPLTSGTPTMLLHREGTPALWQPDGGDE
jgi:hypothetical protein